MTSPAQNEKSLVAYMRRSEQHAAYGFQLLSKSDKALDLFDQLDEAGFFAPANNPPPQAAEQEGFFRIPGWAALGYLERAADVAGKTNNTELGAKLIRIVRAVTHADPLVDNYHTFRACAEIVGALPLTCVAQQDMEMVRVWLGSRWGNDIIVPELDKGIFQRYLSLGDGRVPELTSRALWHCTELAESDKGPRSWKPIADEYWLEQLLQHNSTRLGARCKHLALDCLTDRLQTLFGEKYTSVRTWMVRSAIEPHEQNSKWDYATNGSVDGAREALQAWLTTGGDDGVDYVIQMLSHPAQIVRRLAIHAIDENWELLQERFEAIISPALFEIGHLHELYNLLANHFASISAEAQELIVSAVLALRSTAEQPEEALSRIDAQMRNWFAAMAGQGNETVDDNFRQLTERCGPLREHPDLLSYSTTRWGFGSAKYSKEQVLGFAASRTLLEKLEPAEPDTLEMSRKSQIDALAEAVALDPDEFFWVVEEANSARRDIQYGVFEGLQRAIDSKEGRASGDVQELGRRTLAAGLALVSSETFWSEAVEESRALTPTRDWIPPKLCGIAKSRVANDDVPISAFDIDTIRTMCELVIAHSEGIEFSDDLMTAAINNTRGIAFETLIHSLLRACRDADAAGTNGHEQAWEQFRGLLQAELEKCANSHFEISTLFGSYSNQLMYASEDWMDLHFPMLFNPQYAQSFSAAVSGLSYAAISKKLYDALSSRNIPGTALTLPLVRGGPRERLIERIAIAYSWGQEELEGAVISGMFADTRLDDLVELVATVSRWGSENLDGEQISRGLSLAAASIAFGIQSPAVRRRVLEHASRFISYVRDPNASVMAWLVPVAPFAHSGHGDHEFIEHIERVAAAHPEQMSSVLQSFLQGYRFVYDYQDRLASTVRKLHAAGQRSAALAALQVLSAQGFHPGFVELLEELRGLTPQ